MRYDGLYVNVKRMGLALDGLIRSEYPGDFLQFIEMYTFAKPRHSGEIAALMPKPVTIYDPVVRLKADMSDRANQRDADSAALHEHPARPAAGPAIPGRRRTRRIGRSSSSPTACRRPTSRAKTSTCSIRPIRGRKRRRCARANSAAARGSRSTSSCLQAGRNRARTCSSPRSSANRRPGGCSSPRGRISIGTWCGIM